MSHSRPRANVSFRKVDLIFAAVLLIALAYGGYYVVVSASRSTN